MSKRADFNSDYSDCDDDGGGGGGEGSGDEIASGRD